MRPDTELSPAFIAGVIAAEGYFGSSHLTTRKRFALTVALGATDGGTIAALPATLGVGRIRTSPRRRPHYDDEVTFAVQSLRELVEVVVPFMDTWLPPCHKRQQYEVWRDELLRYWDVTARRRRTCSHVGCDRPQRAKGLCRRHYYEAHGR